MEAMALLVATGCFRKPNSKRAKRSPNPKMRGAQQVYLAKPAHEFQAALRLSRPVFDFILEEIRPLVEHHRERLEHDELMMLVLSISSKRGCFSWHVHFQRFNSNTALQDSRSTADGIPLVRQWIVHIIQRSRKPLRHGSVDSKSSGLVMNYA